MDSKELEHLRRFASTARGQNGFGVTFVRCDGNNGAWPPGKNRIDMVGKKLVAETVDAMHGHVNYTNKKPGYAIGRMADGYLPDRHALGDTHENHWHNGKDPWEATVLLPLFDPETREVYLFTSSNDGGRKAVAALIDAVTDNAVAHPEDADKAPLCQLESDSYINTNNKRIFFPIFSILDWVERPDAVRRIKPPPVLTIESKPEPEPEEFGSPLPRKRRRIAVTGGGKMDDEIPFAPCR
jgi:hypothetical protein